MPDLPTELRIGPTTYHVRNDKGILKHLRKIKRYGETWMSGLEIRIDTDFKGDVNRDTMLHEALHAILYQHRIGGKLFEHKDAREERFIRQLTPVLLGVLRDNPQLVAYLTADN